MSVINKILYNILNIRWRYLFSFSRVVVESGGELIIGKGVVLRGSLIRVAHNARLVIGDDTIIRDSVIVVNNNDSKSSFELGRNNRLSNYAITVNSGCGVVGEYNVFESTKDSLSSGITIDGSIKIGDYNRVRCVLWMRFGSEIIIGSRNAINQRTEIRSDKQVVIGDYNQISYDCIIWDTNTHNMYSVAKRRELTDSQYPNFGLETECPVVKPVFIGSDCWIGRGVSILKGVTIADRTVVAYGTRLVGGEYPASSVLFENINIQVRNSGI